MTAPRCSDEEFMRLFRSHGASGTAKALGVDKRNVQMRRRRIETRHDVILDSPNDSSQIGHKDYEARTPLEIENGSILIGSDAHYWPDLISTAHLGFVKLIKAIKPFAVVMNGDVVDGARISRHPPLGWENKPSVRSELDAVEARLKEIAEASPKSKLMWTMGNHDARFEAKLAGQASEFQNVQGFSLRDHFQGWKICKSIWVNDSVVLKHRYKGGIHATHNNTLMAGKTVVTGHLHSLKVTPFSDYNGIRWGVDTGTLADPYGEQFDYDEDNPKNHRSGFIVLTFRLGKLLTPEVVRVHDESHVDFRGELIKVK